jgi:ABC-type uncharacterized transport system substrate-binding protein
LRVLAALGARAAAGAAGHRLFQRPIARCRGADTGAVFEGVGGIRIRGRSQCCIEYRFAEGRDERLPLLAADLVSQRVAMLVATDRPSAVAAKAATATIPIVFTSGLDPVQIGLVASFNRPGGNATGVALLTTELGPKRLGLLRELLPKPGTIAFVVNPNNATTPFQVQAMQTAAQAVGQSLLVVEAGTEEQVDKAFAMMAELNVAAILYGTTLFFQVISERLVALALPNSGALRMARIRDCRRPHELQHGSQ